MASFVLARATEDSATASARLAASSIPTYVKTGLQEGINALVALYGASVMVDMKADGDTVDANSNAAKVSAMVKKV